MQLLIGIALVVLGVLLFVKVHFLLGGIIFFFGGGVIQGIKKGKAFDFTIGNSHDGFGGDGGCGGGDGGC